MKTALTQRELSQLLNYDASTGVFTRRVAAGPLKAGEIAGRVMRSGYVEIGLLYGKYYAHRLAWLYEKGEWPKGQLDHIDRNPGNNRIDNLRLASYSENAMNVPRLRTNTSGFKGVTQKTGRSKWIAQFSHHGRNYYLGSFDTKEEAAAAYDRAVKKAYQHFAVLNFPAGAVSCERH